ncbi:SDR family NAD(P)-dependent oxidoreductase [Saccharophagus degradans]|uniref:Short-chain dehydrogenase/reductase SDR n=2 Tax=Saccharophagus degradans TaxID=86304 RepID=Q21FJ3_SACD2|nr:glucose 1-dehydrogenase [Saccharophagus degradans]ABD82536.1 short-chain dehydrogenase/reductase SDR [Saccharophagus degradans 2-40]MBU2985274.1 SDR family oxidoreductase [Saccharophagus degradans]MDO6421355.1 SDR family oxidoreductase [Saccharophagus degradans]MDO6609552.1 SDR family oxidoreductase [Saccharophagus degradans]WGO99278.1 SDR family oxidoreductase [Saccharophagus degradans]
MKLENKVCVITGGIRDIGKQISLKLASEGAKLVINYYDNPEQAEQTLADVKAAGAEAILVHGDMTNGEDVQKLVDASLETFGAQIDILVNVAGGLVARKTIDEMDEDFWNFLIKLNLNTTFLLTKACAPHMVKGSSIINFASQAGRDGGGPGASAYATAKGAVMTFTRSMAKELGPRGIRVNALCPGVISTVFHDTFTKDEVRKNIQAATPLRREGSASEVADVVAYLASDESSFLTGLNMDVNGGLYFS